MRYVYDVFGQRLYDPSVQQGAMNCVQGQTKGETYEANSCKFLVSHF